MRREEITQELARATHTQHPSPGPGTRCIPKSNGCPPKNAMGAPHCTFFLLSCAALAVVFWGFLQLDLPLARFMRSLHLPWLELVGDVGNRLGSGAVLVAISVSLLAAGLALKRSAFRRASIESLLAHGAAALCVQVLKHLIGRPRPRLTHGDAGFQFGPSWDSGLDSFPSGHASASFAVAAVLATRFPKARWFLYGAASAVALSRVLRGSHFPTDVVAGVLLGLLVGSVVANPIRAWRSSVVQALTDLSPYLVGVFALLWITVHPSQDAISETVLLVAGVGTLATGAASHLYRQVWSMSRFQWDVRVPPLPTANCLIGVGLALTTGSAVVTLLAALVSMGYWLAHHQAESQPAWQPVSQTPLGAGQVPDSRRPTTKTSQAAVTEITFLVGLAAAAVAIQGLKGFLPLS